MEPLKSPAVAIRVFTKQEAINDFMRYNGQLSTM